jgi:hypothetical protein
MYELKLWERACAEDDAGCALWGRRLFPDHLVMEARAEFAQLFSEVEIETIQFGEMDATLVEGNYYGWKEAVQRVL